MFIAIAASISMATMSFPFLLLKVFCVSHDFTLPLLASFTAWPLEKWLKVIFVDLWPFLYLLLFIFSFLVVLSASDVTVRLAFRIWYKCLILIQTVLQCRLHVPLSPCESHCNTVKLAFFFPFTAQSNRISVSNYGLGVNTNCSLRPFY